MSESMQGPELLAGFQGHLSEKLIWMRGKRGPSRAGRTLHTYLRYSRTKPGLRASRTRGEVIIAERDPAQGCRSDAALRGRIQGTDRLDLEYPFLGKKVTDYPRRPSKKAKGEEMGGQPESLDRKRRSTKSS